MKNLLLSTAIAIAAFTISTQAQEQTAATEPTLVKFPKAVNPKGGYSNGGVVNVRVTVNEQGEVTDAEFVSGPGAVCESISRPDVLKTREAAVELAREARFTPATSGGQPIASTTIMSVEFAASKSKQREIVKGDRTYVAANQPPLPKGDKVIGVPNTNPPPDVKYTIKGDPNYTPVMSPPAPPITDPDGGNTISGGVLNGKAFALPKPTYPAAARAVRASGAVQVQVLIDEDGNVFSAEAYGGHPLLQHASVIAACNSKFSPTLLEGQPVKVSGIITYNFVP